MAGKKEGEEITGRMVDVRERERKERWGDTKEGGKEGTGIMKGDRK